MGGSCDVESEDPEGLFELMGILGSLPPLNLPDIFRGAAWP